jgi:hypothetical protein
MRFGNRNQRDNQMSLFAGLRAVAIETAKLSLALGVILIPLFLATIAVDHVRGNSLTPSWSFVTVLNDVWY